MNDTSAAMGLRDYARMIRERRVLIIVVILAFAGASAIFTVRASKVYEAEASIQFRVDNVDATVPVTLPGLTAAERASVAAKSVNSLAVAERAKTILHTAAPAPALKHAVRARSEAGTLLVIVSARAAKPEVAARIANAFAEAAREQTQDDLRATYAAAAKDRQKLLNAKTPPLVRQNLAAGIARLQTLAATAQPAVITDPAEPPASPISPNPARNIGLGTLLGIVIALVAASVRNAFERRFANVQEIEDQLGLPVLGFVAEDALGRTVIRSRKHKSLSRDDSEAVQIVLANLELLNVDVVPRVIVVTSAMPGEGKTTIAAALGSANELIGKHALVVECDLRNPKLAERLDVPKTPGFTDYVAGRAALVDVVQKTELATNNNAAAGEGAATLSCIVAGSSVPQPVSLLRSDKARQFFDTANSAYDVVVVDTPPLLPVADTSHLIPAADVVLLCLRASKTTRTQARAAKTALERFADKPAGIVLTGLRLAEEAEQYGSPYAYGAASKRR